MIGYYCTGLNQMTPSQQNTFWNSALLIYSCPAAQWHPQQLYRWTGGKRETVLSKNFLLPRKSKSLLGVGFILLAAVWWQMPHLVSRLECKCHHSLSSFKTFSNCLKAQVLPSSHQQPLRTRYSGKHFQLHGNACLLQDITLRLAKKGKGVYAFRAPSKL